jgi:hypothetical protein
VQLETIMQCRLRVVRITLMCTIFFSHPIPLRRCIDRTTLQDLLKSLDYDPSSHPFLKISVGTLLLFRDMQSYQDYLNQLGGFMLREGNRDRYTDTSTSLQGKHDFRLFRFLQFSFLTVPRISCRRPKFLLLAPPKYWPSER